MNDDSMPTEPYGFSNNARRAMGPATWGGARIELSEAMRVVEIEVK
jgi:uncharacterized protein (DUF2141 family)